MNVALIRKLRGALMCLAYIFDILSWGVCKTRHSQTSGRLVQELNACTVHVCICQFLPFKLVVALTLGFAIFAQLKVKWCQANGEDRTKPD